MSKTHNTFQKFEPYRYLAETRMVFTKTPEKSGGETATETPAVIEARLKEGVAFKEGNYMDTLKSLEAKGGRKAEEYKQQILRYLVNVRELEASKLGKEDYTDKEEAALNKFWDEMFTAGCKRVTNEKGTDGIPRLKFLDEKNKDLIESTNAPNGIPMETGPLAPPSPANRLRKVDAEAEAEESHKAALEEKGEAVRAKVLGGTETGKVKFANAKEYMDTKISDIYPDAKEGDKVEIKRFGNTRFNTAVFENGEWHYTNSKQRVIISYNDDLRYIKKEEKGPEAPAGKQTIGYIRMKQDATWGEIAKTIMYTGKTPNGATYETKTSPDATEEPNSPMAVLKEMGYDAANAEDINKYAKILEESNTDKLYVHIIKPYQNDRALNAKVEEVKAEKKKESKKRAGKKASEILKEEQALYNTHFDTIIENKDIDVPEKLLPIVNDEALWNYYWEKGFKNKEKIRRGFQLLNIPPEKIRDVLLDAITQGNNDIIDFEDLLDASNNKECPIYKTFKGGSEVQVSYDKKGKTIYKKNEGEPASFNAFKEEFLYQSIASVVAKNIENKKDKYSGLDKAQIKHYENYADKYEKNVPEYARGAKYAQLKTIVQGAAFIVQGLGDLDLRLDTESAKKSAEKEAKDSEERKERREKTGISREEREPTINTPEERFLQSIFHPENTSAIEDIPEDREGMTKFEEKSSEGTGYWAVKLNCSPNGKLDAKLVARELKSYTIAALNKYRTLYEDKETDEKLTERERLKRRYLLEDIPIKDPDFMNKALTKYKIPDDLKLSSDQLTAVRNMAQDGFLITREQAESKGGKLKLAEEIGEWKNITQILADKSPATQAIVTELAIKNPEFTKEELDKAAKTIEEGLKAPINKTNILDINVGANLNTGKFQLGMSKSFDIGHGFSIAVGAAVNLASGQPFVGICFGKEADLSEQWKANMQTAIGIEPFTGKLSVGGGSGLTWLSKGEATRSWREKVSMGAGVGSSVSFNLTDIYIGPHVRFEVGQMKDADTQYAKKMEKNMAESGYNNVDNAPPDQKAGAIRQLPDGVGPALAEMQINMKMKDADLVDFYEKQLKPSLTSSALKAVQASFGGPGSVSEWGIGGAVDPVKLTILVAVSAAFPLAAPFLAITMFGKLGFVVGNKIVFKQELKRQKSQAQGQAEKALIDYLESRYPTVQIEIGAQTFEDKNKLVSNEFVGDQLERIIKKDQPAQMEVSTFKPDVAADFSAKKAEFAQNHLKLEIDEKTGMYSITPTEVQDYQMYADPDMPAGHGLILKGNKILVATSENLTQLFVKRFDYLYPRAVEGANLHTIITISDNPSSTMGTIMEGSDYYIESVGGTIAHTQNSLRTKVAGETRKRQNNVFEYKQLQALGKKDKTDYLANFYTSKSPSPESAKRAEEQETTKANIALSDDAYKTIDSLESDISLADLPMSPEQFINSPKYHVTYRLLTTNTNPENLAKLDALIKKENPEITGDQLIIYKEKLFQLSMTETNAAARKATIEQRLQWAEQVIYIPFFIDKLAKLDPKPSAGITAETLAKSFISALRQNLKEQSRPVAEGESVMTAVGTAGVRGTRKKGPDSGQMMDTVVEAYDYAQFLKQKGSATSEEARTIARIMLEEHSELPLENKTFLKSRLAKKLFHMGKEGEVPNPLIYIMGQDDFKSLLDTYKDLDNETTIANNIATIDNFRAICNKVREAQLGNGIPVKIDNENAMAVLVNGYYMVIKTSMKSGIYEQCSNPSTFYNEQIFIYKPEQLKEAGLEGGAASDARDVTLRSQSSLNIQTLGLNAVGTYTVMPKPEMPGGGGNDGGGEPKKGSLRHEGSVDVRMPGGEKPERPILEVSTKNPPGGGATPDEGI